MTALQPSEAARKRPYRRAGWLIGACLAALGGAIVWWLASRDSGDRSPAQPPFGDPAAARDKFTRFRDMTATSGVDFTHRNGEEADQFTILESLGGGVALLDYDGDGLFDIFVTGGGFFDGPKKTTIQGHPCKLYRNLGAFQFKDVTKEAGLEIPWWYNHGIAVADYDRDGWPDLLVTGYGRIGLFRNASDGKGGRRFEDVTQATGLRDDSWSTSAGWADIDGDGYPDLYVCHYVDWSFANHPVCEGQIKDVARDVCPPQRFKPLVHAMFKNVKGQAFRDVSAEHGFKAEGCGLGVVLADLNNDGRPDVYVANDATNNFLFLNRGGKLEEIGLPAGAAVDDTGAYNGSMGADIADYDGSGRPALWVTNFQGELPALYQNLGKERFHYYSRAVGVAAIGMHLVGFGTGFTDVDNDGWEDVVIANGHVLRHPLRGSTHRQLPALLRNVAFEGRRFFRDMSAQGGEFFKKPAVGRGLAIGDLDNDGWPDLAVSHINSPVAILRNQGAAPPTRTANWLGIKLVGQGNRDVVGSTVIVESGTRQLTRYAKGGGSYLSAGDPRCLFGLGQENRVQRVTVRWSWGAVQTWENLESNRYWVLQEGVGAPLVGSSSAVSR